MSHLPVVVPAHGIMLPFFPKKRLSMSIMLLDTSSHCCICSVASCRESDMTHCE